MKTIKKGQESMQEINAETYLKKTNTERENMEKTYRNMSEEKKQRLKKHQKNIVRLKSLNVIINKIVF